MNNMDIIFLCTCKRKSIVFSIPVKFWSWYVSFWCTNIFKFDRLSTKVNLKQKCVMLYMYAGKMETICNFRKMNDYKLWLVHVYCHCINVTTSSCNVELDPIQAQCIQAEIEKTKHLINFSCQTWLSVHCLIQFITTSTTNNRKN